MALEVKEVGQMRSIMKVAQLQRELGIVAAEVGYKEARLDILKREYVLALGYLDEAFGGVTPKLVEEALNLTEVPGGVNNANPFKRS